MAGAGHPLVTGLGACDQETVRARLAHFARLGVVLLDGQINGIEPLLQRLASGTLKRWVLAQMLGLAGVASRDGSDGIKGDADHLRRLSYLLDKGDRPGGQTSELALFRDARRRIDALYASDRAGVGIGALLGEVASLPILASAFLAASAGAPWQRSSIHDTLAPLAAARWSNDDLHAVLEDVAGSLSGRRALAFGLDQATRVIHGLWDRLQV